MNTRLVSCVFLASLFIAASLVGCNEGFEASYQRGAVTAGGVMFFDEFDGTGLDPNWTATRGAFTASGGALVENSGQRYIGAQLFWDGGITESPDQVAKIQVVQKASHSWGFMFRTGGTHHYEVHLPVGSTRWRWELNDPDFVERVDDCPSDAKVGDGDWLAATAVGTGTDVVVSVWRWDSDPDLGGLPNPDAWGAPDCVMTADPSVASDELGLGIRSYTGNSTAPGRADHWAAGDIPSGECGNGIQEPGEACDDGGETAACNANCTLADCGDGIFNPLAEECEFDANCSVGEVCNASCVCEVPPPPAVCGNGIVEAGEACDDVGQSSSCDADCTLPMCGDGELNSGAGEECEVGGDCAAGEICLGCACAVSNGQLFSDDFLGGALDPSWAVQTGSFSVSGGLLFEDSGTRYLDARIRWSAPTDTPSQFGKLKIEQLSAHSWGFQSRLDDATGHHYEVHLPAGASEWRWELYNPGFVERVSQCVGDAVVADGDWIGFTIDGSGPNTTVQVWRWDFDPDGGGIADPLGNWGSPDCVMQALPFIDVASGLGLGIRSYTAGSRQSASIDFWTAGDLIGGECGNGVVEPGEACDDGGETASCNANCTLADCDDGIFNPLAEQCDFDAYCGVGEVCNTSCLCEVPPPVCSGDADCEDGVFCNGVETCGGGACVPGADPCPGQICDEVGQTCTMPSLPPDDPSFPLLWGLDNQAQTGGTADADIDALEAWALTAGSRDVVVAVLDTGVDYTHEDLAENIWTNDGEIPGNGIDDDLNGFVDDTIGWDFYNDDNDPFDDGGHGTHIAGIIGALGNNGLGVVGVNHRVRIMALKMQSSGQVGSIAAAIEAIDYSISMGARVISNSWAASAAWGEPGWDQPGFAPALQAAIERANAAGVLFVATAGNSAENKDQLPIFPASYDNANIVSVAASDANDAMASWSSYGPNSIDLAAPGVGILSTTPATCQVLGPPPGGGNCDGSGYLVASGTSMATPHVAGVAALVLARYPGIAVAALKDRLLFSVEDLPGFEYLTVTGGRLNAASALVNDSVGPAAVTDLAVTATTSTTVTLSFTAPGDDGSVGQAREYDVRYSTSPIDAGNFANASPVSGLPRPLAGGASETVDVAGLAPLQTYYFALRAVDNVGNSAPVSNSPVGLTTGVPGGVCGNGIVEAGEDCEVGADCAAGELCLGCSCAVSNGQPFSDDFLGGALDPSWAVQTGSFSVSGGLLFEDSGTRYLDARLRWSAQTDTPNQFGKLNIEQVNGHSWGFQSRLDDATGHHYEVHLPAGGSEWRWELYNPGFVERISQCVGDAVVADGDWIGYTIDGSGPSTTVQVWRWDFDPDGGGVTDPIGNWGTPDCVMQTQPSVDVSAGRGLGIRSYTARSTQSASIDSWTAGDLTGGECGNSVVEPGEECDDGAATATCNANCTLAYCDDGIFNPLAEQCEFDTNCGVGEVCNTSCFCEVPPPPSVCGNGILEPGEDCDAGGETIDCDADCTFVACGDGVFNPVGEQCEQNADCAVGEICLSCTCVVSDGQLFSNDFDGAVLDPAWSVLNGSFSVSEGSLVESGGARYTNTQLVWDGGLTDTPDQFAKLQLVDPGVRSWGFMLRYGDSSGHHHEVHLPADGSEWRWELYDPDFVERVGSCLGDQPPAAGDWLGVAIEGAGTDTKVSVWRWDANPDPGAPDLLANWGPPDCQMQVAPSVDVGGRGMGVRSYTGGSTSPSSIDNWLGGDLLEPIPDAGSARITRILSSAGLGTPDSMLDPDGIAVDSADNVYVAACGLGPSSEGVFKITPDDEISLVLDSTGDGLSGARCPVGIAVDSADNVYVATFLSDNVFRISASGVVTEVLDASGGDVAPLVGPIGVAVDADDTVFVTGYLSNNVFAMTASGEVEVILDASGGGTGTPLELPFGVAVDAAGNVFVAGFGATSDSVFKVATNRTTSIVLGPAGDGAGNPLEAPHGVAVDAAGNVYVTGNQSDNVFRVTPAGAVTVIADAAGDGAGNPMDNPTSIAVDPAGNVYVAAFFTDNAFQIPPGGTPTEIIDVRGDGTTPYGAPSDFALAIDSLGNVYVAGVQGDAVFRVEPP